MQELFRFMARHDGVATAQHARSLGVTWPLEQRLVAEGALERAAPGVLRSRSAPDTWRQRARISALAPGDGVISHGAAARLHELDGFDRYGRVDVLCRKGWWPNCPDSTVTHFTRGLTPVDVADIDGIRVLSLGATLALLAPTDGVRATAKALDSALRAGATIEELREAGRRWTRRGRPGPRTLLMLLDERDGMTLPASWFQRLAKRVFERQLVRLVDEYPVYASDGSLLARLDLAEPTLKIGLECQSWRWHATPDAQHRDARRKGRLRRLGWEIIDVWWRDLDHPGRVIGELDHVIATAAPNCLREISAAAVLRRQFAGSGGGGLGLGGGGEHGARWVHD